MQYQVLFDFEQALAQYTGAPFVVITDCATHAIELALRYDKVSSCSFTPYTYLSIPMVMHKLHIEFEFLPELSQSWIGEYKFHNTRIWDSARRLERGMYRHGEIQCLSFGNNKPLQLGRCGAILLDDQLAYRELSMMRSDGRDLKISPWQKQTSMQVGYHYCPSLEICDQGIKQLATVQQKPFFVAYPDCRKIDISHPAL